MELSKTEEQLMKHLWSLERCFLKDLLDALPEPKPATTTVATLLRRMIDKEFVGYRKYGKSREYYPRVSKAAYFGEKVRGMISDFFGDSPTQFASFFTAEADLSEAELRELQQLIESQLREK
jgi:predicted transcriptional regulator